MSAETDYISVGDPLPVIEGIEHLGDHTVRVRWAEGPRAGRTEDVDLGEAVVTYRIYAILRDAGFFQRGYLAEDGNVIRWDTSRGPVEMSASMVEHYALLTPFNHMPPEAFCAWMERNRLTLDGAAEALGLARRLVAYYRTGERSIPRTVALACAGYDSTVKSAA